ncbi:MAG: 16S rRNA (uracil(1498)-N(3))-methyltransferase [Eggerthella lenta]
MRRRPRRGRSDGAPSRRARPCSPASARVPRWASRCAGGCVRLLAHATAVLVCWGEAPLDARIEKALERGLRLDRALPENARIAVVVGPEGGLSRSEADALLACNPRASLVSLGSSILRTETAGTWLLRSSCTSWAA